MRPPRSVYLKWPFGHPLGEPGRRAQQLSVLYYAIRTLYAARTPGAIAEPGWAWRRQVYTEPRDWAMP